MSNVPYNKDDILIQFTANFTVYFTMHMCMHTSQMTVYINCRKVHTQSAKKWLERLQKEEVPVIVCLTFGDKLYAEHMTKKREHPNKDHMKMMVKEQLSVSCIIE